MLIENTSQHTRTGVLVEPFGKDGAVRLVPIKGDQPGDPFILDPAATRKLAVLLTGLSREAI